MGHCHRLLLSCEEFLRDIQLEVKIDLLVKEVIIEFFHHVDFVILIFEILILQGCQPLSEPVPSPHLLNPDHVLGLLPMKSISHLVHDPQVLPNEESSDQGLDFHNLLEMLEEEVPSLLLLVSPLDNH